MYCPDIPFTVVYQPYPISYTDVPGGDRLYPHDIIDGLPRHPDYHMRLAFLAMYLSVCPAPIYGLMPLNAPIRDSPGDIWITSSGVGASRYRLLLYRRGYSEAHLIQRPVYRLAQV